MLENQIKQAAISCIFILFLSGCASASISPTTNNPPASSPTAALQPTASPGITVSPSIAPTVTVTPIPKPSPTVTALPTIAPEQAGEAIKKILTSNDICSLPCFAGITPGKSSMKQAESFFASFSESIYKSQELNGFAAEIKRPDEYYGVSNVIITFLGGTNVFMINAFRYNYPISELMDTYGKPESVFFYLQDPPPPWDEFASFELVLDYSSKGFMANYLGEVTNGNVVQLCTNTTMELYNGPFLILWEPGTIDNFKDVTKYGSDGFIGEIEQYVSFETVLHESMEEFYQVFDSPSETVECVQISNPNMN